MDDVIAEVAARHGIAIGRDDPILVLHTINARLLQQSAAAQQALLDAFSRELEASASRWDTALAGSKETVACTLQEGAITTAAMLRAEVDAALAQVAARLQDARRIALLNVAAACITLAAAGIVVWGWVP
jgi:hypothetical protein